MTHNKINIISHITTHCNFSCSYCNVIKDNKNISQDNLDNTLRFIKRNSWSIERFKFFWGEPLLAFKNIKYIIDNTKDSIANNYEIVTNTSLLNDEVGEYFEKYFSLIFFSIDTENSFNFEKVGAFIKKYNLEKKVYFNLIINPDEERQSLEQFSKLYNSWIRGYNILPVYFTKKWDKNNLLCLSKIMKEILDTSLQDPTLRLYGFQQNSGYKTSLSYHSLFIDIDGKVYYSDIVSTFMWQWWKQKLYLWHIDTLQIDLSQNNDFDRQKKALWSLEQQMIQDVIWQKELHKIMDYFSQYLNKQLY